jgi:hypothetical protein
MPGRGYYWQNQALLDTIDIPVEPQITVDQAFSPNKLSSDFEWIVRFIFGSGEIVDSCSWVGVGTNAERGQDRLDWRKPPTPGSVTELYLRNPEDPLQHLARDVRPVADTIISWQMVTSASERDIRVLRAVGLNTLPAGWLLAILDRTNARGLVLQGDNEYTFSSPTRNHEVEIIAGPDHLVSGALNTVLPGQFDLAAPFPNPFNPRTTLGVSLPQAASISLEVYGLLGEKIAVLHDGVLEAGRHWFTWGGANSGGTQVGSGAYFIRCRIEGHGQFTQKVVLLR